MLGESGSGKTENCRMIIQFLSKISGRFIPLQRQRSSNSIASFRSSPNSCSSTPKHKASVANCTGTLLHSSEKSSCFKADTAVRNKKLSRVEFDFSYQKCNDNDLKANDFKANDIVKFCPKHNCCSQAISSSSSNASNPIEIPKRKSSAIEFPTTSKSFTLHEHRAHKTTRVPNCLDGVHSDQRQMRNKCESLDLISVEANQSVKLLPRTADMSASLDETIYSTRVSIERPKPSHHSRTASHQKLSYNKTNIDLDIFKSAKRKVPTKNLSKLSTQLNHLEVQTMKERIAQAEIFLEAMGCASMVRNRDSSRYVSLVTKLGAEHRNYWHPFSGKVLRPGMRLSWRFGWRTHYAL